MFYDENRPTVRRAQYDITQSTTDAVDEFKLFMDGVISTYTKHNLPHRAESATRFLDDFYFIDRDETAEATKYFGDELACSFRAKESPIVLHVNAEDEKDRQVGSSEYITYEVYKKLGEYGMSREQVPFLSAKEVLSTEQIHDRPIYIFDDWIISGGQINQLIDTLGGLSTNIRFRFVALRDNWPELVTSNIAIPQHSLEYYHRANPIKNVVEGPSIIGVHSSVNIGWQNRLATFAFDIAHLERRTISPPALGDIVRPYRTRISTPKFYREPPENDLLSWRNINGVDPDSFTEFTLQTIAKLLRRQTASNNKPSI